jgi:hypothetical protein
LFIDEERGREDDGRLADSLELCSRRSSNSRYVLMGEISEILGVPVVQDFVGREIVRVKRLGGFVRCMCK